MHLFSGFLDSLMYKQWPDPIKQSNSDRHYVPQPAQGQALLSDGQPLYVSLHDQPQKDKYAPPRPIT